MPASKLLADLLQAVAIARRTSRLGEPSYRERERTILRLLESLELNPLRRIRLKSTFALAGHWLIRVQPLTSTRGLREASQASQVSLPSLQQRVPTWQRRSPLVRAL